MRIFRVFFPLTLLAGFTLGQQPAAPTAERTNATSPDILNPDIDPLALQVLKATTDTLKNAKVFSFRAMVQRESTASNGQVLTFVRRNDITISRPNKARINITGEQQDTQVFFSNGEVFLYSPKENVYAGVGTSSLDLDSLVEQLDQNGIFLPMSPLFRSDPYRTMSEGLQSAYVIGRVEIDGKTFHHLAFTEPDSEWQLWVEGGSRPLPRRAQVIYKTIAREPRVIIDFTDWNLAAEVSAEYFVFKPPPGVKVVTVAKVDEAAEKPEVK